MTFDDLADLARFIARGLLVPVGDMRSCFVRKAYGKAVDKPKKAKKPRKAKRSKKKRRTGGRTR